MRHIRLFNDHDDSVISKKDIFSMRIKLVMAALAAMLLLALGAGTAAASRSLTQTPTENQNATSAALTFTDEGSTFRIVCPVTLELSGLVRSIPKTAGTTIARTNVRVGRCSGGTVRVLAEAQPWTISYVSFTGTLPRIESVRLEIRNAGFLVEAFFGIARCLYGGNAQGTTVGGTRVTSIRADEARTLPLVTRLGEAICPRNGVFRGSFTLARTITLGLL